MLTALVQLAAVTAGCLAVMGVTDLVTGTLWRRDQVTRE
jgi:hypothetical protein